MVPALIVVLAVIIFPWLFTIWMSLNEWKVGSPTTFVGLANYLRLPNDPRFIEAVEHTLVYTALSVLLPLVFGTFAAVVFHALNGVRVMLVDFWHRGTRLQRQMLWVVVALWVVLLVPFLVRHLGNVFGA